MKRQKKQTFEDKNPEFVGEVAGMSREDLKNRIAGLVQGIRETEQTEKDDQGLQSAKAEVKEMKAPYTETKKVAREKLNYVSKLLEEKGN